MTEFSWLFILAFPNGGSTALAKLLLTAPGTLALTDNAEGQWLVPALSAPLNRWNPSTTIDFDEVRQKWIEEARRRSAEKPYEHPLVIEKSPPNMCRYKPLVSAFEGADTTVIIMTRDPFATCASWHSRYGFDQIANDWGFVGAVPTSEREYFEALAEIWLVRAAYLEKARTDAYEILRYEDLTDDPSGSLAKLVPRLPVLKGIDFSASLSVKDYSPQRIRNMNNRNVELLTSVQREFIRRRLSYDSALVDGFGYSI